MCSATSSFQALQYSLGASLPHPTTISTLETKKRSHITVNQLQVLQAFEGSLSVGLNGRRLLFSLSVLSGRARTGHAAVIGVLPMLVWQDNTNPGACALPRSKAFSSYC